MALANKTGFDQCVRDDISYLHRAKGQWCFPVPFHGGNKSTPAFPPASSRDGKRRRGKGDSCRYCDICPLWLRHLELLLALSGVRSNAKETIIWDILGVRTRGRAIIRPDPRGRMHYNASDFIGLCASCISLIRAWSISVAIIGRMECLRNVP